MSDYSWPCFREGHKGAFCYDCARNLITALNSAKEALEPVSRIVPRYFETGVWPDNFEIKEMCDKATRVLLAIKEIEGK